ncbi:hypothetical protein [Kangiella shandongensis]|uniref:hypothetical protein n=1 Tax=Kangiella shandongensis TaxID=2763258 RepID=UPI001CC17033|nr:hypothetical protein [Kangiella shandongensis]
MKKLLILSLLILVSACGGRNSNQPEMKPLENAVKVYLPQSVPYYDPMVIASNIKAECSSLGSQLSSFVKRYSTHHNIDIVRTEDITNINKGYVLVLKIRNAMSAGNAWSGHKKQVLITADLLKNGEKVKDFTATRNSMGGVFGGFKGSCDVLQRTVNTLGSDTAIWLSKNL